MHFSKKYSKYVWFCDGGNILTASDFDILSVSLLRTIFFEYSKCESVALKDSGLRIVVFAVICVTCSVGHLLHLDQNVASTMRFDLTVILPTSANLALKNATIHPHASPEAFRNNSIQSQFEATCHWFLGSSIAKLGYHLPL